MSETPLDREAIVAHLRDVADALAAVGPRHTVVVVGGSLLALHGLRRTTVDVDSVRRIDAELRAAIASVARLRDLAPAWLNDSAAAFRPSTFDEAECEELLTQGPCAWNQRSPTVPNGWARFDSRHLQQSVLTPLPAVPGPSPDVSHQPPDEGQPGRHARSCSTRSSKAQGTARRPWQHSWGECDHGNSDPILSQRVYRLLDTHRAVAGTGERQLAVAWTGGCHRNDQRVRVRDGPGT